MDKKDTSEIVIVVPPFQCVNLPALGASILVSECRRREISASVYYANLTLARLMGYPEYLRLEHRSEISESVFFWSALRDDPTPKDPEVLFERLIKAFAETVDHRKPQPPVSGIPVSVEDLMSCLSIIPDYLDHVCEDILACSPRIVGFSCMFSHALAAFAIARRLRQRAPHLILVLGGASALPPMGETVARLCPWFDVVFSGESDIAFPTFAERYLDDGTLPPGVIVECGQLDDLDQIPVPNYDDYFHQAVELHGADLSERCLPHWLLFESSRGCYRFEKHPCTFCGLNKDSYGHRHKSAGKILQEIQELVDLHGMSSLMAVDTILPHTCIRDVLPVLAQSSAPNVRFFYQVPPKLKTEELDLFVKAGVEGIQPGIETLSSPILKLVRKGTTALQNVCLLRDCLSRQINVTWNCLLGVPGDRKEHYEAMLSLIAKIEHLQPPTTWRAITIDRFSCYFNQPQDFGITDVRPFPTHRLIYSDYADLEKLTYQFMGDYDSGFVDNPATADAIQNELERWNQLWATPGRLPMLRMFLIDQERTAIHDSRSCAVEAIYLPSGEDLELLAVCNLPIERRHIPGRLLEVLSNLEERHFILEYEERLVSVVTDPTIGQRLREG